MNEEIDEEEKGGYLWVDGFIESNGKFDFSLLVLQLYKRRFRGKRERWILGGGLRGRRMKLASID